MFKKVCIFFFIFITFTFLSCSKQKEETLVIEETAPSSSSELEIKDEYFVDTFIDPESFFTLDYTPYLPETEFQKKNITDFTSNSQSVDISNKENNEVINPLRPIDKYNTKYSTTKSVAADSLYNDTLNGEVAKNSKIPQVNNEPFTVTTWGPKQEIPASIREPEFYVMFSEPVVPLAALGKEINETDIITITPPIEGVYRWNGTSLLSFIPSNPIKPEVSYTITVKNNLTSLTNKEISGPLVFNTTSEPLKIVWSDPGYKYKETHFEYFNRNDVPPEACKEFRVRFNYLVDASEIKKVSTITIGNKKTTNFDCVQEKKDTVTYYLKDNIPTETEIVLSVNNGATASYSSVEKFTYQYYSPQSSYGKYSNPVYIDFSHPLDSELLLKDIDKYITTSLDYTLTKENITFNGNTLIIYDLPVTFKSTYTITLKDTITDIYGRKLGKKEELKIEVPNADSSTSFTDYGACILEAQFPHIMVFEHQNILPKSYYYLEKTDKPLDIIYTDEEDFNKKDNLTAIPTEPENVRILEKVELDPFLNNGKGMVRFEAYTRLPVKRKGEIVDEYTNHNSVTIQVTDLGVTTRMGINKTVVLVTRLSDGKPVSNAKVYLYDSTTYSVSSVIDDEKYFATAITNEDGLAVLNYNPKDGSKWFNSKVKVGDEEFSYMSNIEPAILVTLDNDKVTYHPTSHSPWRNGIYSTSSIKSALNVKPSTFMFCDRGLYKPGEKVTFRGIDKNLNLGSYKPYIGQYKIKIKENGWNDTEVLEKENFEGLTTKNGGFYGSFIIPEDAVPGNYTIEYERLDEGVEHKEYLNFQVAFFERLKFQASMKMPQGQLIAGDKIQSTAQASYLAGGALAGAKYRASWYSEPWYFVSEDKEFEDYRFGPINRYDNMSFISNESGMLNGVGKAVISCNTTNNSIKGTPYRYKVSTDITDASNQLISTTGSVVVHPSSFYIGLSKPHNVNYLVKKGEKLNFDYKLSLLDGTVVPHKVLKNIANSNSKIKVELLREEWNVVQQQGIHGDVYPRYVKEEIIESEQEINLDTKGKVSVTPKEVGYYTVRLSTKDKKDREVITEYSFFATGSTNSWVMDTQEAEIKVTPDQNLYNPGDTATLLLESPLPSGNYLITVEREGIFSEEVVHFDSSVNTIEIPIARNYVPVCYVSVSSYSVRTKEVNNQYGVTDVDKPKGYYGATTLHINPYVKAFSVDVKTEKMAYKPGEEATITVTATKGGKPLANAEITLLAVDRGVLDLIDYHIPNPIEFFYSEDNFPLRVNGGDNRSLLMDPVTYAIKNLAGGDSFMAESAMDKLNERKDFNPTALFEPILVTDENGQATCTFKLPDTLTTYRITAFGVKDELLALQENEFAVQNQINVQQVTPRRLRERDTAEAGVILTNLDSVPHNVTIELNTVSPLEIKEENGVTKYAGKAIVDGENKHTITVNPGLTIPVYFDIAAKKAGVINLEFTVTSDILNEKLIYPLDIEKPYIYETVTTTGQVTGKTKEVEEGVIIPSFAEDGLGSLTITLDATRLGPLGSAVNYVFNYPYGCLEQQASKILPLVIFEDYIDIFNMDLDAKITNIHNLVVSYFENWNKYQLQNGGFGYWPSSNKANYYVTARIAHVYALALERGYTEKELKINKEKLLTFMMDTLIENNTKNDEYILSNYENAYLKYVVSLLDSSKIKSNDLLKVLENPESDVCTLAISGLTALEIGDKKLAEKYKEAINKYLRPTAQGIDITDNDESTHYYIYNSKTEQLALTLQLYASLDNTNPLVTKLIYSLLKEQQAGFWQSTAATARVFDAFYTLIKAANLDNLKLSATAKLNGKELVNGTFEGVTAKPIKKQYLFTDLGLKPSTVIPLTFEKEGKGDLYYTATMTYALPNEVQIAKDRGISIVYKLYDDSTGEEIKYENDESTLLKLESGKMYKMDITISSPKDLYYVALRSPIPSGCEIIDSTFVTSPKDYTTDDSYHVYNDNEEEDDGYYSGYYYMSNQNILDNEIQFFWDYFQKGTTKASFKFRAARRGVYPTPPINAECMYESEIFGRTYGSLYTIE